MIEELKAEVRAFYAEKEGTELGDPEKLEAYIARAEEIIAKYPSPEGEERKEIAKFYSNCACWIVVFGQDLERGIPYYRKSIELDPDSFDIRLEYYTTLEELVEDDSCRTPDLVQDAVDCLKFCINYCAAPEHRCEKYVPSYYIALGRVYLADGNHKKAALCAKTSRRMKKGNKAARKLLKQAKKGLSFFERISLMFSKEEI